MGRAAPDEFYSQELLRSVLLGPSEAEREGLWQRDDCVDIMLSAIGHTNQRALIELALKFAEHVLPRAPAFHGEALSCLDAARVCLTLSPVSDRHHPAWTRARDVGNVTLHHVRGMREARYSKLLESDPEGHVNECVLSSAAYAALTGWLSQWEETSGFTPYASNRAVHSAFNAARAVSGYDGLDPGESRWQATLIRSRFAQWRSVTMESHTPTS